MGPVQTVIQPLKRLWAERPLLALLLIALLPRLVAAIVSQGFGMHDDHFGPIEQPFMIMNDISYWSERTTPHGHSIVYPTLHYALFNVLEPAGVTDPKTIMTIVRLLHALYSLLIVLFGYRIASHLSGETVARRVGLVLALFWALPWLSVRNLTEVVCIPPLLAGFYYVLRSHETRRAAALAGAWFALAFAFRYQTLMMTGTVGLIMLYHKNFKEAFALAAGFVVTALLIQGTADLFAWGYPFASFAEYVRYNLQHGEDYTTGPWHRYTTLVVGAFIPPMSFCLVYGMFRNWRKTLMILLPVMVFFILHSYFPNKQERFIFPVIPALLMLGVTGWQEFVRESAFWERRTVLLRSVWIWFWVINTILLVPFTTYYSKKSRIEAMYTLYGQSVNGLLLVGGALGTTQPAYFYAGQYPIPTREINGEEDMKHVAAEIDSGVIAPDYVILFGEDDIDDRVTRLESTLSIALERVRRLDPSFVDYVLYRMNPGNNKNEVTFVYEVVRHDHLTPE